jgi:phosphoglycerate dehydrogenase-like enzyme
MDDDVWPEVYGPDAQEAISAYVNVQHAQLNAAELRSHLELLEDVDVLLSSWGGPVLDSRLLASAPRLKAVFYAAGSVRHICPPEFWERGIPIVSAKREIGVRVADFTHAVAYLALKNVFGYALEARSRKEAVIPRVAPGTKGATIGVVSLGAVGQAVCERLTRLECRVIAFDPYAEHATARALGVELVSLAVLFSTSDVVTLHAPLLPETAHMVAEAELASMKRGATLVNTARGGLVDERALIEVLQSRPDLFAFLDVTDPEPPLPGSRLFELDNVLVTPHIAGNSGAERRALGTCIAEEVRRFATGEALKYAVSASTLGISA